MSVQENLNKAVKIAQGYILLFLKEYLSEEEINKIEKMFTECPVIVENIEVRTCEFGRRHRVNGYAEKDKITIASSLADNKRDLDDLLGTIIHEYAHRIIMLNNRYGKLFEEAFASIFAEVCINNANIKLNGRNEMFYMRDCYEYQQARAQVTALLCIMKEKGLDLQFIVEYIAGDREKFKETCLEVFGEDFSKYYESISDYYNKNTEEQVIEILTNYIKQHGFDIKKYWTHDFDTLREDNLYFLGNPIISLAVANAGREAFPPEDAEYYKYSESSAKVAKQEREFVEQERIDRAKNFFEENFSLKGDSREEIYSRVCDLCAFYVQHLNRDDADSKATIAVINNLIPDFESFKTKFVTLRVKGRDRSIFDDLDLETITYEDIVLKMDKMLQEDKESKLGL